MNTNTVKMKKKDLPLSVIWDQYTETKRQKFKIPKNDSEITETIKMKKITSEFDKKNVSIQKISDSVKSNIVIIETKIA